jgi:hypothetical protein
VLGSEASSAGSPGPASSPHEPRLASARASAVHAVFPAFISGTLTLTVTGGLATFSHLSISLPGVGYTLHAHVGSGLPDIDSDPFTITM